jgi:hypothetical protein
VKEVYLEKTFNHKSLVLIRLCDDIVNEYAAAGYKMTVRQIYYRLVASGHIENTVRSYENVQGLLNNARLAGLIDWDAIEDRTREISERPMWSSGGAILSAVAHQYHEDRWARQESRVFLIVEKEALAGVMDRVCREWDVPMLAARGYPSATTLRELAKTRIMRSRQRIVILHLGDHDPSGIDMSRDLTERLELFSRNRVPILFKRLALNMDQVDEQNPPPNPAKVTDSRFKAYQAEFGDESWELDALTPQYLHDLIATEIQTYIDPDQWEQCDLRIERVKDRLSELATNFDRETPDE